MTVGQLTWWDILGCIRSVAGFALVLVAPGFCIAWILNISSFRRRPLGDRVAWSISISLAIMGITCSMVGKWFSLAAVCWICVASSIAMLAIAANEYRDPSTRTKWKDRFPPALILWTALGVIELVDIVWGKRLLFNETLFDHALRTAFTDAVMRTGVPPANPLFWPGHAVPMRYYYFWYILSAAAAKIGHATARQALIGSVVWSGFCLAAILKLYCSEFLPVGESENRNGWHAWPRFPLAAGMLLVTGLDILVAGWKAIMRMPMDPDMEWWSGDQVTSWLDSLLWVPHHVCGLVCCAFGFLMIWVAKGRSRQSQAGYAALAAFSFASAAGLSVYVALAFAIVMIAWMVWALVWEAGSRPRIPVALMAGVIATLILIPFLRELTAGSGKSIGPPLLIKLRRSIDPGYLLGIPFIHRFAETHPRLEHALANAALLPPGYLLEFGFFLLAPVWMLRRSARSRMSEADRTALFLTVAGLLVATFLRSTVISNNDFGIRSILVAQFFLLLLAVRWWEGAFRIPGRRVGGLAWTVLCIGVAGSVYQAIELRFYIPVHALHGQPNVAGLGARAWAWREGFAMMDRTIPVNAVVQYNISQPSENFVFAEIAYVGRQTAVGLPGCGIAFGGTAEDCNRAESEVESLFPESGTVSADEAREVCRQLQVSYLVASRWDGVWNNQNSWAWNLPVNEATDSVRVMRCE